MNGTTVDGLDDIAVEPPRNLAYFIALHKTGKTSDLPPSHANLKQYRSQHPKQNTQLQGWIEDHRILSKFSQSKTTCGKGFDFLQEEDLKSVLKHLPKGTMFDFDSFGRAVRMKQNIENYQGCKSPQRNRPYEKYDTEVQACATVMMKNEFTAVELCGTNPYSEDLLKIHEIFDSNQEKYFTKRVEGFETSSLKLTKLYFTEAEKVSSQQIENQTKKEIVEMILNLAHSSSMSEIDVDNLKDLAKISHKKQYLINLYEELIEEQMQADLGIDLD